MYHHTLYFYGFTVFGFWLPIVLWSGYLPVARDKARLAKWILVGGLISLALTVDTANQATHVYGLADAAALLFVAFFVQWWKDISYWQAGTITYFTILITDVVGAPVMSAQAGWLPAMLVTNIYHADFAHYECIGGAGAFDGLLLVPAAVVVALYVARLGEHYLSAKKGDLLEAAVDGE